jgi:hypothetical protein
MKTTNKGLNLTAVLFIVFLILKLTNNIDWSWIWVTSPLWIPVAMAFCLIIFVIIIMMILLMAGKSLDDIKNMVDYLKSKNTK